MVEGLSAAAAAHNIVNDKSAFEQYHMYAFLFWVVVGRVVQAGRRLEIVLLPPTDTEIEGSARWAAGDMLARIVVEIVTLCIGFFMNTTEALMIVLLVTWLVQVILFVVPVLMVSAPA